MPLFMNLVAAGLPQPSPTPADPEATMPVKESGDGRATRLRRRLSRPLTGGNKTKTTTAVSTLLAEANTQEAGQAGVLKRSDSMANSRTRTNLQKRPAPTQEPAPTSTASSPLPTVGVPSRPPPVMRLASAPPVPANYRRSPPASPTKSLQLVGAAPMVRRRSSGGYSSASPLPTLQSLPPVATPVRFPTAEEDYFSSSPPSSSSSGLRFSTSLDRPSPGSYLSASRLGNDVQEQDEAADEMGDLPSLRISTSPTATSLPDNSPATIARERAAALARLEAASSTSQAGSVSSYGNNSLEVTPRPSSSSLQTETGRPDAPATAGRPIGGLSLASPDLAGSPPSSDPGPIHFPLKSAWRSPARGSGQFNPPAFAHGESSESLVHPPFSPSMSPRRPYPMRRSSFSSTSPGGGMQTASVSALSLNLGSDPYSASRTSLQLDTVQELEPSTSAVSHPSSPPRPRRSRSRTGQTTVRPPAVRRGSTSSPVRMGEYTPPPTIGDEEVIRFALAFLKRELGAGKMRRRPASMYVDPNVHADLSDEEREFWGALQDGVLLCKLVNSLYPDAITSIERRDTAYARETNLATFLKAARDTADLDEETLFAPSDLMRGDSAGLIRAAKTILALRDAAGKFSSSDDERPSWGRIAAGALRTSIDAEAPRSHHGRTNLGLGTIQYVNSPTEPPVESPDHSSEESHVPTESIDSRNRHVAGAPASPPRSSPSKRPPFVSFASENPVASSRPDRGTLYADRKLAQSTIEVMTFATEERSPPRSARLAERTNRPIQRSQSLLGHPTAPLSPRIEGSPTPASRAAGRRFISMDGTPPDQISSRLVPGVAGARVGNRPSKPPITRGTSLSEHILQTDSPRIRPLSAGRRYSATGRRTSATSLDVVDTLATPLLPETAETPPTVPSLPLPTVPFPRTQSAFSTPPEAIVGQAQRPSSRPRHDSEMYVDRRHRGARWTDSASASRPRPESMSTPGLTRDASNRRPKAVSGSGAPVVRQKIVVKRPGEGDITYQLGECIGRGQFGAVYRALNLNSGRVVAIKRIALANKKEDEILQLANEVELLKQLSHPSVVRYEGTVQTEHFLNILLEYVENGSLAHLQKAFGNFSEQLVASYTLKILEGLQYLHSRQVVHCDLKAANILTTKNGNIKLSDFGVSLNLNAMQNKNDVTGTPNWMAPEVIQLDGASTASDIWSLACTIIELLTGRPPYGELAPMSAMYNIVEEDCPPLPPEASPDLQDFLRRCFAKQPIARPDAVALFGHPWLKRHWIRELHPQDSIPFLRRLSQGPAPSPTLDGNAPLPNLVPPPLDQPGASSTPESSSGMSLPSPASLGAGGPFLDAVSIVGSDARPSLDLLLRPDTSHTPPSLASLSKAAKTFATHAFVKSRFSKEVHCRVCQELVRKHAVICEECGLFCHIKCAELAPVPCDLRAQLLSSKGPVSLPATPPGSGTGPIHPSLASSLSNVGHRRISALGRRLSRTSTGPSDGPMTRPPIPARSASRPKLSSSPSGALPSLDVRDDVRIPQPASTSSASPLGGSLTSSEAPSGPPQADSRAPTPLQPAAVSKEAASSRRRRVGRSLNLSTLQGARKAPATDDTRRKRQSAGNDCVIS